MARPKKKLSELSSERLRKLSPFEIQQRKEQEKRTKEAHKQRKIFNTSIKKYLKDILNDNCNLSDIQIILPYINELHFIEELLINIKKDIHKNGVIDELRNTNPLLKEYNSLVKQKGNIIKEVASINKKRSNNSDDDINSGTTLNDLFTMLED